ncbi:MAG: hypothetical protein RL265_1356 [Bacteroidota bacterium]|jgi:hypothetical protein
MQNFKNHAKLNPLHHFILAPITLILLVWSSINLVKNGLSDTAFIFSFLLALAVFLVGLIARMYATKNQDRTIRLEMRLRYFEMTGTSFSSKEKQLKLSQIIALRFAGDAEILPLLERAIAENLSSKEIKLAITDWQGDYNRV